MELSKRDTAMLLFFEKGYTIDDSGNVKNKKGIKLNPYNDGKGYLNICIRVSREGTYKAPIHRVQAYKKYGDKIFSKKLVVRHLDSNPSNNSKDNIELGTQSQNMYDKPKEIRSFRHPEKEIMIDINNGVSVKDAMVKYNVKCKQTITKMIERNR